MRPQMASRGFPGSRGERRPEEAQRPWQFSRYSREPRGLGLSNYLPAFVSDVLPIVQPESLFFTDSNKLHGGVFGSAAASGSPKCCRPSWAWNTANTIKIPECQGGHAQFGFGPVFCSRTQGSTRLRRAEVSLGLGPLAVDDRLKLSGEIILRRYWRRNDFTVGATGTNQLPRIL